MKTYQKLKRLISGKASVEIYYRTPLLFFDEYEKVAEFEVKGRRLPDILEQTYRRMNAINGSEKIYELNRRSMCVGDLVKIEGRTFKVDNIGWSEIRKYWPKRSRTLCEPFFHIRVRNTLVNPRKPLREPLRASQGVKIWGPEARSI